MTDRVISYLVRYSSRLLACFTWSASASPSADTAEGLAEALHVKHAKSLEEYLTKYEITLSVMQTAAALERVAYEFVIDAAADGVCYVEVRYSPLLHRPALTLTQAIEAPLAGIRRAEAETGTKVGVIVCAIRTRPPAESLELARAAAQYRSAGVVAFDLAGPERGHPAREHAPAFEYAAAHGMACTCHAGERKSTRLNSSHPSLSRMPSSA